MDRRVRCGNCKSGASKALPCIVRVGDQLACCMNCIRSKIKCGERSVAERRRELAGERRGKKSGEDVGVGVAGPSDASQRRVNPQRVVRDVEKSTASSVSKEDFDKLFSLCNKVDRRLRRLEKGMAENLKMLRALGGIGGDENDDEDSDEEDED